MPVVVNPGGASFSHIYSVCPLAQCVFSYAGCKFAPEFLKFDETPYFPCEYIKD